MAATVLGAVKDAKRAKKWREVEQRNDIHHNCSDMEVVSPNEHHIRLTRFKS